MLWSPKKHRRYAQIADFVTGNLCFLLAFKGMKILYYINPEIFPPIGKITQFDLLILIGLSLGIIAVFDSYKAYDEQRFTSIGREIMIVFKAISMSSLLSILTIFLLKLTETPRTFFILFYFISLIVFSLQKITLFYIAYHIRKKGNSRKSVLIIGSGVRTEIFIRTLKSFYGWGLDIKGILSKTLPKGSNIEGFKVIDSYDNIDEVLKCINPEEIIITLSTKKFEDISKIVDSCQMQGVQVRMFTDFFGKLTSNFQMDNIFGLNIMTLYKNKERSELDLLIKRFIDVVLSSILLVVLLPLFLGISIAIVIQDGFPVFFKWNVVGYNRKPIRSWKFRTMVKNADELKKKLLEKNEMGGPVFKMTDDPRILEVGRFLRKYSLDELPQLFSVLKGDLSLVGPRPPLIYEFDEFSYWHRRKLSVKPGITCLWQISGRNNIANFDDWAKLDLEYIDNWSLELDIKILLKTIPAVLTGRGAK